MVLRALAHDVSTWNSGLCAFEGWNGKHDLAAPFSRANTRLDGWSGACSGWLAVLVCGGGHRLLAEDVFVKCRRPDAVLGIRQHGAVIVVCDGHDRFVPAQAHGSRSVADRRSDRLDAESPDRRNHHLRAF